MDKKLCCHYIIRQDKQQCFSNQ
uniref:Uncharacterized protein n=1 Tax=Arundo donax TaxID=35708 RepID=A0A0A8Z4U2_ARUDO